MNYEFNNLYNKYTNYIENLSNKFNYDDNIKHLITLVLILFIKKYGFENEKLILKCFDETYIIVRSDNNKYESGYFYRKIKYLNGNYNIEKYIIINNLVKNNYIELIDTIIHEFNHAINSFNNEIKIDENYIYLRTGLSYIKYDKNNVDKFISKTNEYVLEEIINSKQSEEIINDINNINALNIDNLEMKNFVSIIKSEIFETKYETKAYILEKRINNSILNNKTFFSTMEVLRIKGLIDDIESWFDNIVGKNGTYDRYNELLYKMMDLELNLINKKGIKMIIENKLKGIIKNLNEINDVFNNNTSYK